MTQTKYEFTGLSTREGFNRSLRHFKMVGEVVGDFEARHNLADILNALHEAKRLEANQIAPVVNALCVGHPKYTYLSRSHNLTHNVHDSGPIAAAVGKWNGVDLLLAYYHPDLGLTLINPKNPQHWEAAGALKKNELVTIYAGTFQEKAPEKLLEEAIEAMIGWLEGRRPKASTAMLRGKFKHRPVRIQAEPQAPAAPVRRGRPARAAKTAPRAPAQPRAAAPVAAPAAAAPSAKKRMTPMYSIPVTNELFHNGNVEAWKRIIQSYNHKYPGTEVFVFYEGERIHDINTLFKWGKVKHGSSIMIAVAGDTIQDVAKLQRYLRQGASPAFEAFLRFPVNTILNLF
jgi:hypothetical protein